MTDEYWSLADLISDYASEENAAYYLENATSPEYSNVQWSNSSNWSCSIFTITAK